MSKSIVTINKRSSNPMISIPTIEKVEAVMEAARRDPVTFGPVLEKMNATGQVQPAFRKVQEANRAATRASTEHLLASIYQLADDFEAFVPRFDALEKKDPEMARIVSECLDHGRQALRVTGKWLNRIAGSHRRGM